jgi:hypothetical protein
MFIGDASTGIRDLFLGDGVVEDELAEQDVGDGHGQDKDGPHLESIL